jgi:protoporphyrinogen oxidase
MTNKKIAVIAGAGPAGLTAALELLRNTDYVPLVFEADTQVGGISKTVNYRGNRMDLGGHRFFSKSDWVMNWWQELLPAAPVTDLAGPMTLGYQGERRSFECAASQGSDADNVMLLRPRLSRIYYRRRFFDYPLKLNGQTLRNLGLGRAAVIGTSYLKSRAFPRHDERTLEDFFINRFGHQLYQTFFKDYTEKVWGVPCTEISSEWGAQRIKGLSITSALKHAIGSVFSSRRDVAQKDVETSLIERFLYPKFGPGQMWEVAAERILAAGGVIKLRQRIVGIHRFGSRITGVDVIDETTGTRHRVTCDAFVSTMPLAELVRQLKPDDSSLLAAASALPYRDFMTAGLIVRKMRDRSKGPGRRMPPDNWVYIQEPDVRLGRLQIFNNWSPYLVADPATVSLGLEYFCQEGDDLWSRSDPEFLRFAAAELEQIGLIDAADVIDGHVVRQPKAYPAYFGEYRQIGRIRDYLDAFPNLFAIGRNGMHRYNNQDHSMLAARAVVELIRSGSPDRGALWAINAEDDYHEERGATAK